MNKNFQQGIERMNKIGELIVDFANTAFNSWQHTVPISDWMTLASAANYVGLSNNEEESSCH